MAQQGGLLDFFGTPAGQGLLAAGLGMAANAGRGGTFNTIGRGGLLGLAGFAQAQEAERRAAEDAQQREFRTLQMDSTRANLAADRRKQDFLANLPTPGFAAGQTALAGGGGPTVGNAATANQLAPFHETMIQGVRAGAIPLTDYLKAVQPKQIEFGKVDPKDYTPESLAEAKRTGDHTKLVPVRQMSVVNGQAVNLFDTKPGTVFNDVDPNKAFNIVDGQVVPNQPFQQFSINKARAGASKNILSPVFKQEGEEAKTVGKFFGDQFADIQKAGFTAQTSINRFNRLGQLLEGVDTGKFAPLGLEVAKTAKSVGLDIDPNLSNKEAAVALSSEIALQLRNPSGGAGMPGAMSDADRNFLTGMVPGIEKTPEGRKEILETAKKLAQRDADVARMAREYRKKNGALNEGFFDELSRFSEANPLFERKSSAPAAAAPKPTMRWNPKTNKLEPV